jgi:hypothetical protein
VSEGKQRKTVRSYRLVFRRRWRIFRIQGWRIPLPGGVELRLLGYWLACLGTILLSAKVPLLGLAIETAPPSLRLLALPLAAAWLLSRWEIDGRPPHRALAGLIGWRIRPRTTAALRRVRPAGSCFAPLSRVVSSPDLAGANYPRGSIEGPARLLLRYPVSVEVPRSALGRSATAGSASAWRLRPRGKTPLHAGRTIEVPAGRTVHFEGEGASR